MEKELSFLSKIRNMFGKAGNDLRPGPSGTEVLDHGSLTFLTPLQVISPKAVEHLVCNACETSCVLCVQHFPLQTVYKILYFLINVIASAHTKLPDLKFSYLNLLLFKSRSLCLPLRNLSVMNDLLVQVK